MGYAFEYGASRMVKMESSAVSMVTPKLTRDYRRTCLKLFISETQNPPLTLSSHYPRNLENIREPFSEVMMTAKKKIKIQFTTYGAFLD